MPRFTFAFEPRYRAAALPFGITPRSTWVEVTTAALEVRFGPWRVETPLANVAGEKWARTGWDGWHD